MAIDRVISKIASARSIIPAATAVLMLAICGAASAQSISSPSTFKDDYDARLAADDNNLWFAAIGSTRANEIRSQVFAYRGGSWKPLPGRPLSTNDVAPQLTVLKIRGRKHGVPCLGDMAPKETPRIRCFKRGRWHSASMAEPFRSMFLTGMSARGRTLTALFSKSERDSSDTTVRVARLHGNRLLPYGPPLKLERSTIVALGQQTDNASSGNVDVTLQNFLRQRWIATLRPKGWSRTQFLPKLYPGSQFGSVRSAGSLYFPVVRSVPDRAWPFSIYRKKKTAETWTQIGDSPLNMGAGKAQGGISPVGNRVWATWEQNGSFKNGLFSTQVYAALINRSGTKIERKMMLWSGRTIFPGPHQAIEYKGAPVFLYGSQTRRDSGLRATVDFSHR